MFDFIRNLTKSEAVKGQEMITAYLDSALSPSEHRRFEQLLADDPALQASVARQRLIKQQLRQLPRVPAPRNFTLDPALYGRPQPQAPTRLYPYVRFATAMAGILLVVLLATDLLLVSVGPALAPAEAPVALEAQELAVEQALKESTRTAAEPLQGEMEMAGPEMTAEDAFEEAPVEALAEEMSAPAGETDLSAMATEPVGGEPQPTAPPAGTAESSETSRQAEATLVAESAVVTQDEVLPGASQAITNTGVEGQQTVTLPDSAPDLEEAGPGTKPVSPLRLIEIGLLMAVILLVGLNLYLRRQL